MNRRTVLTAVICALGMASAATGQPQTPLRVYFVGNSVTDTIDYRALAELAKSRGHKHVWGRHMIPGAPLQWIWQHPKDGFQEPPFGHYPNALANHQWDALSLQPFDRHLTGKEGDLVMAKNFIDLALPKSPDLQVYVYARWPRQGKDSFDTAWLKKYTGGWDGTNETKDYFERLSLELRKAYPKMKKPILMVPVGHVMYELNQRMKAGQVPGFKQIKEVYADGIHLNNVGSYVVGCTFFATLYKENPKGLPGESYKVTDPKLAEVIQETVWKVVSTHAWAGITTHAASQSSYPPSPVIKNLAIAPERFSIGDGDNWPITWADWSFPEIGYPVWMNAGRNYDAAQDDFAYMYSPDTPSAYKTSEHILLARVPKSQVIGKEAYEFFAGLDKGNKPRWTASFQDRKPVFTDPGHCYRPEVVYHPGLKRYLLCTATSGSPKWCGTDERYLGVFDAPTPWGPWTVVKQIERWGGEENRFQPRIPAKWISEDGRSFYLLYSCFPKGPYRFNIQNCAIRTGKWPATVVLRLHLRGLESLRITNGEATVGAFVTSVGDPTVHCFEIDDGKEIPLGKDSASWMDIRMLDAKGAGRNKSPLEDGYFEVTVPKALLEDQPGLLTVNWIDFYRG